MYFMLLSTIAQLRNKNHPLFPHPITNTGTKYVKLPYFTQLPHPWEMCGTREQQGRCGTGQVLDVCIFPAILKIRDELVALRKRIALEGGAMEVEEEELLAILLTMDGEYSYVEHVMKNLQVFV
jgi:hypothetical protein